MIPFKRFFLVIPMMIMFILLCLTVIIPVMYWVFTGNDFVDLMDDILNLAKE